MRSTGILLRLLANDLWHLPTVTTDRRYVRARLLVAHHCAGSLRSQTVGTGSCWVPHTAAVIADVKPSWYILSYEVLNDEAEAHTGADGGDVQNLEMQLFLKKHYLHPVAYRAYRHSGYALSLWIRGAHAPTEKKRKVQIKIAIVSINPRPAGGGRLNAPPSGFSRIAKKRRRAAPPGFHPPYPPIFSATFVKISGQGHVRSGHQVRSSDPTTK